MSTRTRRAARPARRAPASDRRVAIGLSSGTSADGVDAALVELRGEGPSTAIRLLSFACLPYPDELRAALLRVGSGARVTAGYLARLDMVVGEVFAAAALALLARAGPGPRDIAFIGSHGQTVAHFPRRERVCGVETGATCQLGSLSVIAERTGITTVGNFRVRDVAAGGEGAPLLPYVDWLLFRSPREGRALLNIGGIANITFLPRGGGPQDVVAFDVGPGNMVIDGVVHHLSAGRARQDTGGALAARGRVAQDLLRQHLVHPFFQRPPPRSTGREAFGETFVRRFLEAGRRQRLSSADLVATATALTAHAIRQEIGRWAPGIGKRGSLGRLAALYPRLFLSGGGGENPVLVGMLRQLLRPIAVLPFDELELPSRAREAASFAVLANECLARRPANLPRVTGARRRAVLGEVAGHYDPGTGITRGPSGISG